MEKLVRANTLSLRSSKQIEKHNEVSKSLSKIWIVYMNSMVDYVQKLNTFPYSEKIISAALPFTPLYLCTLGAKVKAKGKSN